MINNWKFVRAFILIGCLVLLSLNVAAQGLGKISPDVSPGFLELNIHNEVITITAIGEKYRFDAGSTLDTLGHLKNQTGKLAEQCQREAIFLGKKFWEKVNISY